MAERGENLNSYNLIWIMPTQGGLVVKTSLFNLGIKEEVFFMSELKNCGCPWSTNGATLDITGCRFSLAPMSDRYVDIILDAIGNVDTSKVWSHTDHLSTVYRGKRIHVIDTVKSCFIQSYKEDVHMTLEATFSKGCPGDSDGDSYLSEDDTLVNEEESRKKDFNVSAKISFYPLGDLDYMNHIIYAVNLAKDMELYHTSGHYVTILEGSVHTIFEYFERLLEYSDKNISHYVLQATLSVNSPSKIGK